MKVGPGLEVVLAPQFLTRRGVEPGEDSAHAQCDHFSVAHCGRTTGAGETLGGAGCAQRFVAVAPDFLAVGRVETSSDLVSFLAGEDVNLVADDGG
jgi:hypothetical protein